MDSDIPYIEILPTNKDDQAHHSGTSEGTSTIFIEAYFKTIRRDLIRISVIIFSMFLYFYAGAFKVEKTDDDVSEEQSAVLSIAANDVECKQEESESIKVEVKQEEPTSQKLSLANLRLKLIMNNQHIGQFCYSIR